MLLFISMTKLLQIFKSNSLFFLFPVLSGILVGTSYIPFNGWALLFCYIPLWLKVISLQNENQSLKQIFFAGWITQFLLTLIGFNWIYYVSSEFGRLPWFVSLGALLLFAGFMHLYVPFSLIIATWITRRLEIKPVLVRLLIIAFSISFLERIWPSIFEWNLGYTLLWIKFPLFQWADTVGFWGLSTLIFLVQAFLADAVYHFNNQRPKAMMTLLYVAITLVVLTLTGHLKGKHWAKTDQVLKVAVAQGNVGNAEKIQSEKGSNYHSYIRSLYTNLTTQQQNEAPAQLMIWPETALPFPLDQNFLTQSEQTALMKTVNAWSIPVITGGYSVNLNKRDSQGYYSTRNAVFYLSPYFNYSDAPYYKTNLLAFGEYMPFGDYFPFLYKLLPFVGQYEKGSGPLVAKVAVHDKTVMMGPQICYDSLYPAFSRGLADNGAQILFNVTNDSWFGWWAEPFQHQFMTLARAIEVRRPLVRSTNTGISSAILADGTLLENSPIQKPWAHTYDIKYNQAPARSLYSMFGYLDWVLWLMVFAGLLFYFRKKNEG